MVGEVLEGATMELYESDGTTPVKDADGNAVTWESGEEPKDIGPYLTAGESYVLKETAAPTGYEVVTDITFTIDETGKVTLAETNTTGESEIDENGYLVVKDSPLELKINKTDLGGTVLEGATMELYESDGKTPVKDADGNAVTWISGS